MSAPDDEILFYDHLSGHNFIAEINSSEGLARNLVDCNVKTNVAQATFDETFHLGSAV